MTPGCIIDSSGGNGELGMDHYPEKVLSYCMSLMMEVALTFAGDKGDQGE